MGAKLAKWLLSVSLALILLLPVVPALASSPGDSGLPPVKIFSSMSSIVACQGVTKSYGDVIAVNDYTA